MTSAHQAVAQVRSTRTRRRWSIAIGRLVLLVLVIAVWQIASVRHIIDPTIVSSPGAVWHRLAGWTLDGTLWFHSAITIEETLVGFVIGSLAGIALGFGIGQSKRLCELLDPFILAVYSIPKVALAPLFVVWFGIGIPMKIILAAVTVLFIVFYNTLAGVRNVDPDLIDAMWLMGANSRQILFRAVVPSAMGWALTGVRIAIPYALIGAIIGELIASNRGIGYLIASSGSQYDTAGVFAALLVLTILAVALNAAVDLVERRTSLWKIESSVTVRGA